MMPLIEMLKNDLGITTVAYDERLTSLISTAQEMIAREGITLRDNYEDAQLIVMYAAYLWRRRDTMEQMPRMLRYALNNRVFSEKVSNG